MPEALDQRLESAIVAVVRKFHIGMSNGIASGGCLTRSKTNLATGSMNRTDQPGPSRAVNFRARLSQIFPINCFASNRAGSLSFSRSNPCARFKSIKASCADGHQVIDLLNLRNRRSSLSNQRLRPDSLSLVILNEFPQ